jgi:phospholipid transport system substrate-binding protein
MMHVFGNVIANSPAQTLLVVAMRWVAAILLAFGIMSGSAFAQLESGNQAEAFIQQSFDKAYDVLTNDRLARNDRQREFRRLLTDIVDVRRIAMFTLGRYANTAQRDDIDSFTDALSNYLIAVYESRLSRYRNQALQVMGSTARGPDDVVVNGEIVDRGDHSAKPYRVAFRLRQGNDGRFRITDLNVEGVWQSLSERADFTAFLQQHGGDIRQLADDLDRQAQQIYERRA